MITFCEPGETDVTELVRLKTETFAETYDDDNDPATMAAHIEREFSAEKVAGSLADDRCTTVWALEGGVPVGYLKVNRSGGQTEPGFEDGLEVEQLYVRSSHHGRGLGAALLARAEDLARAAGLDYLWLSVWERNTRAIAVYEHRGFKVVGEHVFMLGDEAQRDLLMRVDLPVG